MYYAQCRHFGFLVNLSCHSSRYGQHEQALHFLQGYLLRYARRVLFTFNKYMLLKDWHLGIEHVDKFTMRSS